MPPLLQELLEACFYRAHPELKTAPCEFDWQRVSARNLRELEHKRRKKRPGGRSSTSSRRAAQERFRQRQKARLGVEEFNARRAAQQSRWLRSEAGIRYEARLIELEYAAAQRAAKKSRRLASRLTALALADLEAPTYVVAIPGRQRTRERWPLRDEAAAWLATHESGHQTNPGVQKQMDTSPETR